MERRNEHLKYPIPILFIFLLSGCGVPERPPCYHYLPPPVGKDIGAEVLLAGSFYEHWEGQNRCLEIYARLIDVETQEILGIKNIYNRWKQQEDIDFLSKGLSQVFIEEFPL